MTAIITVAVFMWKTFLLASTLGFMILDSGVNNTGASGAKRLLVDANKVRTKIPAKELALANGSSREA
ncbi:hypothetical protein YC2023_089735 [Brassica napus]